MPTHVFVVSEWLPKEGCEHELWLRLKNIMALSLENEKGCLRAHATKQVLHPGAPSKSEYSIILLQEYVDLKAFDIHCASDYVAQAFKEMVEDPATAMVADWRVRLFSEEE